MESNWRFNVLVYGMQDSDWELCARIPEFFPREAVLVKRTGSPWMWLYYVDDPDQLPDFFARYLITPDAPHFPYGIEVDPD